MAASFTNRLFNFRFIILEFVSLQDQESMDWLNIRVFVNSYFVIYLLFDTLNNIFSIFNVWLLIAGNTITKSWIRLLWIGRKSLCLSTWIASSFFWAGLGCITSICAQILLWAYLCSILIFFHYFIYVFIIKLLVLWNLWLNMSVIFK